MSIDSGRVQDELLNHYRKFGTRVRVLLMNGDAVEGAIKSFDATTIKVALPEALLVVKTSIAMIAPLSARARAKAHKPPQGAEATRPSAGTPPVIERKRRRVPVFDGS